jgi:hypothetical protein
MPLDATILADTFHGYAVHWIDATAQTPRRTRLCTLMAGCEWHHKAPPAVWTGYVQIFNNAENKPQIMVLTADGGRSLNLMYRRLIGLRGIRIIACREGDKPRGRVLIARAAAPANHPIPDSFDMGLTLMTLFSVSCLPEQLTEGEDCPPAAKTPDPVSVDEFLPWEKGGAL